MSTRWLSLVSLLLVWSLVGCREDKPQQRTVPVSGTIEKIDLAKRTVEVSAYNEKTRREDQYTVHVTDDTEVLVNGSIARMEDVRVGERAEGTIKIVKENGSKRFVAVQVNIDRAEIIKAPEAASAPHATAAPANATSNGS
jgi:uncharacterized protein YdbL (DUF1318 family)